MRATVHRPHLLYDSDCHFCSRVIDAVRTRVPTSAVITPWQQENLAEVGVTEQRASQEMLWIDPHGRVHGGSQAFARLFLDAGGRWAPLGVLLVAPPTRWLGAGIYRAVARNRHRLPGGTTACSIT